MLDIQDLFMNMLSEVFEKGELSESQKLGVVSFLDKRPMQENHITSLLICVDFEEAYDSIEWGFLFEVLKYFNFGQNFI